MSTASRAVTGVLTASRAEAIPADRAAMDGLLLSEYDRTLCGVFRAGDHDGDTLGERGEEVIERGRSADGDSGLVVVAESRTASPCKHERRPLDRRRRSTHDEQPPMPTSSRLRQYGKMSL